MLSDLEVINKMIYAVFIISTALMTALLIWRPSDWH